MKLEFHPLADCVPLMTPAELNELTMDIAETGLKTPGLLYEGKILDGRHRYLACAIAGVEFRADPYEGSDPVGEVASLNLKRRNLRPEQKHDAIRKLLLDDPGRSNREIAAVANVSDKTIAAIREAMGLPTAAEVVQAKIEQAVEKEPRRSSRSIAKEVGVSHHTVEKIKGGRIAEIPQNAHPGRVRTTRSRVPEGPAETFERWCRDLQANCALWRSRIPFERREAVVRDIPAVLGVELSIEVCDAAE